MFFKPAFVVAALATLAVATPARRNAPAAPAQPASQCNTGSIQCCTSTQDAQSSALTSIFGLLDISPSAVSGLVGVTCSPISVIGVGGDSCSAAPVCCEDNSFNGLIALGCVPVNLSL